MMMMCRHNNSPPLYHITLLFFALVSFVWMPRTAMAWTAATTKKTILNVPATSRFFLQHQQQPSNSRHASQNRLFARLWLSSSPDDHNNSGDNIADRSSDASFSSSLDVASSSSSAPPSAVESTISSSWVTSFDDAGRSLVEEENQQRISQMGDFDSNPAYQSDRMEQMRAAIQARTASLGMEKSKISQQIIQENTARAAAGQKVNYSLDLSKITTGSSSNVVREELPEGLPSMFFDPEEQMTEEEKIEADPDSQLSLLQQAAKELQNSKWPTFWGALREVALMLIVVAVTAALIIGWDKFLRELYMSWGFIPRPEDALAGRSLDGLELPEGWTNNMSEQDVMRLENEMTKLNNLVQSSTSTAAPVVIPPPVTTSSTPSLPDL